VGLAVNKQKPPPPDKETVLAALPQGRPGLHACRGLAAWEMLTLSQQRGSTRRRAALDGADSGRRQEERVWSCGEAADTSVGARCG